MMLHDIVNIFAGDDIDAGVPFLVKGGKADKVSYCQGVSAGK
jgi:hypothetical protein